jgi:cytochrome o ubiquinol oxidase subunit IV
MEWAICCEDNAMHEITVKSRAIGFVLSLVLTLAAYFIITSPAAFHLETNTAILVIFILAVLQFIVQSVFFLNIWSEKGPRWNLLVFISTLSIIFIIIVGSIWIMNHLNYNMGHGNMHPPTDGF